MPIFHFFQPHQSQSFLLFHVHWNRCEWLQIKEKPLNTQQIYNKCLLVKKFCWITKHTQFLGEDKIIWGLPLNEIGVKPQLKWCLLQSKIHFSWKRLIQVKYRAKSAHKMQFHSTNCWNPLWHSIPLKLAKNIRKAWW